MATTIPKLITDTDKYFQYEGSANPTTQDELQAYMKNEHSIVECLTDMLWQPSTSYNIGHVLRSPNMPKGFQAVALVTGTTGANEPDWGDGSIDITDGSMKWKVTTANITVNGISPDASGNISITSVTNADVANELASTLPIANGGTGATTVADARANLGLSTAVTGASISGKTITLTFANGTTETLTTQDTNTSNWSKGSGYIVDNTTGAVICWGSLKPGSGTTVTFPRAFPTAPRITTSCAAYKDNIAPCVYEISTTKAKFREYGGYTINWIGIG